MNFSGEHTFNLSQQELWNHLMDPQVLAKIIPGGKSELETLSDDHFKTTTDLKLGPVKGSFVGELVLVNKNEPESFGIEMKQNSKIGNAHADMELTLETVDNDNSKLSFKAGAKLSGVIARTGARVMSGVAQKITKDIFASIEKHIEEVKQQ